MTAKKKACGLSIEIIDSLTFVSVFCPDPEISSAHKLPFGKTMKAVYDEFDIPENLEFCHLEIDADLYKKTNMGKYILSALSDESGIVEWKAKGITPIKKGEKISSPTEIFEASLVNLNPHKLIAAISNAINEHSAALGKKAVLLDTKALNQISSISNHLDKSISKK